MTRRRAARLLLRSPMLVAGVADDADLRLIRTHGAELRSWFDRETGWRLVVDPYGARLYTVTATVADDTRPARDPRNRNPFTRTRYVLCCLALAALTQADGQTTLGRIADDVLVGAADPQLVATGFRFALDGRERRADLVAVVRLLLGWGVLRRVNGDEETYLSGQSDVLYDVDHRVVGRLLAAPQGPSTIGADTAPDRLAALVATSAPDTDELRNRALRHHLTRRLLTDPVVYYGELNGTELAYLHGQRAALTSRIEAFTGLLAEVRAEGIAMVDPDDELTDVRMPAQGMQSHLTLLLATHIAGKMDGCRVSGLHALTRQLAVQHRAYWRKSATEPGAEIMMVTDALTALTALRLVSVEPGADPWIRPLPAIARYAIAEPTVRGRAGR
jgi:uncharacterized protein (TIGR02678 family)